MQRNLRAILGDKLEPEEAKHLYKSYDIIGDIAVVKVPEALEQKSHLIAEAIIQIHKHVNTVLRQSGSVSGDRRLRALEWIAGDRKTETLHKEHGCAFKVDLEKCYFSSRLSNERMRVAQQVQPREVVVNMFAGVGCFSVVIAKHSEAWKIHSIDINPIAVRYAQENSMLNGVEDRVLPVQGDACRAIQKELKGVGDRVLMPLPKLAYEYLDCAVLALKPQQGWIHYYDFEHANKGEEPVSKTEARVSKRLREMGVNHEIWSGRIVRTTGPRWYQTVIDVEISP